MRNGKPKLGAALVFVVFSASALVTHFNVTSADPISVDPDYIYVCIGESKVVKLTGGNFTGQVQVTSSDPTVASGRLNAMSRELEVTGVDKGEVIITVTDADSNSTNVKVKVFTIYMSS
jgi:uncharacterized protein YjdB